MSENPSPETTVRRLIAGFFVARALHVTAELGIADLLAPGPRGAGDLARATGADADALRRLLRCLAAAGLVEEQSDGTFASTVLLERLETGADPTLRAAAIMLGRHERAWSALEDSMRTGATGYERVFGAPLFEHLDRDEGERAIFDAAMDEYAHLETPAICDARDFSEFHTIVDVGGGYGELLAGLLARNTAARGVLFDLPATAAEASTRLAARGLAGRVRVVAGDFFESVPTGGDAYILKSVLHDWSDDRALSILERCRGAMAQGASLFVVERVMPERVTPGPENLTKTMGDLAMLVVTGGRERTESEFRALLQRSGFSFKEMRRTREHIEIIESIAVR